MDAVLLSKQIQEFIAASQMGAVIEDGEVVFDLAECNYSLSSNQGRCMLHFWSSERNCVRRVLDAAHKNGALRLQVERLGRRRPTHLEICSNREQRTQTEKQEQRAAYEHQLERALLRHFPGYTPGRMKCSIDLAHSFGPVHARGTLRKGQSMFAVVGVNAEERQAYIDGTLTVGLLWLDHLREREAGP